MKGKVARFCSETEDPIENFEGEEKELEKSN